MAPSRNSSERHDALAKKREFLRAAMRVRAAIFVRDTGSEIDPQQAITWAKAVKRLCATYSVLLPVAFKILGRSGWEERRIDKTQLGHLQEAINHALNDLDIEIRVEDAIIGGGDYIELNDDWRARAGSYISHIRDVVSKAEINEPIRERIFRRLNDFRPR